MQSYPLDLKTLLHLLARKRQSGQLYAGNVKIAHVKESLQAHLTLIDGEVKSCLLLTRSSDIYADESEAFQMLIRSGVIEWQWHEGNPTPTSIVQPAAQPAPPPPRIQPAPPLPPRVQPAPPLPPRIQPAPPLPPRIQPAPPPPPRIQEVPRSQKAPLTVQGSSVPIRALATNEALNALSHGERKILMLMDGVRTIYEIAGMLSISEREELLNVLRELHRKGLIIFNES
jgi:hypothetical protein